MTPAINKIMKMRKILLGLSFLITITAFCQKNGFQVLNNKKVIGKILVDSSDIEGIE